MGKNRPLARDIGHGMFSPLPILRSPFLLACLVLAALTVSLPAADFLHAGFLYDDFDLTLAPGHRVEAAGPFFYDEQQETRRTWAIPPLLSFMRDPAGDVSEFDLLYPVLTLDRYGSQSRWQFCQVFSFASMPTQTQDERAHLTIFPIYFQQRSSDPSQDYTAVFPFYGHLKNRLFRDESFFVMFPIFGETRKKDVITDNVLYPFFHLRHGDGLRGWQFWPVVGSEHKEVTWRTNEWNEAQVVPGHDKFFVLWPLFFNEKTGIGTTNLAWEQTSLPAYSILRSPVRDSTTIIWPFFSHVIDREKKYREWDAPWPLIEFARGEGKTTTRVWPFFSQAHSPTLEDDFYLWPVYKYTRARLAPLDRKRTRIAFFLFSDLTDKNTETGASDRQTYLWPLFLHRRDFNGNSRWQFLDPLEPFVAGSHKIARDYSPLWSVWRSETNPHAGASSQSLLWNFYRRDVTRERTRVSAVFGLFQHESDSKGTHWRVFYIPLGGSKTGPRQARSSAR